MAGKLVQVATSTVTSSTSAVQLVGTTTDDVYMLAISDMQMDNDNAQIRLKFLASGTPQSTSNYDDAAKVLIENVAFVNHALTNYPAFVLTYAGASTNANARYNSIHYLYNLNDATQYSYMTIESAYIRQGGSVLEGKQGSGTYTVAEAHNGVEITALSGNVTGGTFTLYKVI